MESIFNSISLYSHLTLSIAIKSILIGTIFSLLIIAFRKILRSNSSEFRYLTLWLALVIMILIPLVPGSVVSNMYHSLNSKINSIISVPSQQTQPTQSLTVTTPREIKPSVVFHTPHVSHTFQVSQISNPKSEPVKSTAIVSEKSFLQTSIKFLPFILSLLWISITTILFYRIYKAYHKIIEIKSEAKVITFKGYTFIDKAFSHLKLKRKISVAVTDKVKIPMAAGFKNPMILLPKNILHELSDQDLEIIVLHELTHLKRWDDFGNLLQKIVEAVAFFNPAIRWVGKQLDFEREVACDAFVIDKIKSTHKYADCLTRLMQITSGSGTTLIPAVYTNKKQIFKRFEEMLMNKNNARTGFSKYMMASVLSIMLILSVVLIQITPAFALPGSYLTYQEVNELFKAKNKNVETESPQVNAPENNHENIIWQDKATPNDNNPAIEKSQSAPDNNSVNELVDNFVNTATDNAVNNALEDYCGKADFKGVTALADLECLNSLESLESFASLDGPASANSKFKKPGLLTRISHGTSNLLNIKGTSITEDDGETSVWWNDDHHQVSLNYFGEIEFTEDDRWIKSISEDGYFNLTEKRGRKKYEIDIESNSKGELDIIYSENGDETDFDDDAKEWLGDMLVSVFNKTGLNAEKRVQRIYAKGGADAVLDAMDNIESDYVYRLYFTELLLQDDLSDKEYARVLSMVENKIDSDYDKAEILIAIAPTIQNNKNLVGDYVSAVRTIESDYEIRRVLTQISFDENSDEELISEVLKIAERMDSDYEKAELLIDLAPLCRDNPNLNTVYVHAMENLESDYETRRIFSALGRNAKITDESLASLVELSKNLDSDYERAEYLIELAHLVDDDDIQKQLEVLNAVSSIESDYEARRVLESYSYDCSKNNDLLLGKLRILTNMDSDYEKVQALLELSECASSNSEARELYLSSLQNVESDYERKRALTELISHSDLRENKDMIRSVIALTNVMDSDYEKCEILKDLAEFCVDNEELEELLLEAADSFNSEYETEQIYKKLNKRFRSQRTSREARMY